MHEEHLNFVSLNVFRQEVQVKYGQIVLLDPDVANKHNVEQALWKSAFYQVIEVFRRIIMEENTDEEGKEKAKQHLLALLEEVKMTQTIFNMTVHWDFRELVQVVSEFWSYSVYLKFLENSVVNDSNLNYCYLNPWLLNNEWGIIFMLQGSTFYEGILKNLQNTYGFQLEEFTDSNQLPPESLTRPVKLALLSAQRTMICLGDIARYREQTNHTTNYGKARRYDDA